MIEKLFSNSSCHKQINGKTVLLEDENSKQITINEENDVATHKSQLWYSEKLFTPTPLEDKVFSFHAKISARKNPCISAGICV